MKKIFTLIVALVATVSMSTASAASYKIVFQGNGTSSVTTKALTNSNFLTSDGVMESGIEYISSVEVSKVYQAERTFGVKLNTANTIGSLKINLAEAAQVKATKIVVAASAYVTDWKKGLATTLSVNDVVCTDTVVAADTTGTDQYSIPSYNFALTGDQITSITVKTTSTPRVNVKSIEVFYEDEATAVEDVAASKEVASVKYYNLAGVESETEFNGINVKVTTYADGTKKAIKVIK